MKTVDFLSRNLGRSTAKWCSSVYIDYDGIAYSYGRHYPLAVIIDGEAYINARGYSNSTSRHISWATSAAGRIVGPNHVHKIDLIGTTFDRVAITASAEAKIKELDIIIASKKRKDTSVYLDLQRQRKAALDALYSIVESNYKGK